MRGRILIIYYSSHAVCGIGTWLETLVPQLQKNDWEVTVGLAQGARFHDPAKVESCRPGLPVVWMDGRTGSEEGRVRAIANAICRTNADIVVLNCLNSAFAAVSRLRRQGRKVRLVTTNHGNFSHQAAALLSHRDEIDLAVCIGRQSLNVMGTQPWGFSPERLVHLPNAVQMPSRKVSCRADGKLRVGYAGRLDSEARKRIMDLLPFYSKLHKRAKDVELWIAGDGDLGSEIEQFASRFDGAVRCFGALTRDRLFEEFYPCLDVFVNFSSNEAFGLSIAEAMAHGVPVVTSEFFGFRDEKLVLPHHNSLTFPIGDIDAAVCRVMSLLSDPSMRSEMGRNAYNHLRDNFSPQTSGKRWTEALTKCLSQPELKPVQTAHVSGTQRFLIPESFREFVRCWTRRYFPHQSPGDEWPHYRCTDSDLLKRVSDAMGISSDLEAGPDSCRV